jgi:hypothetical protein
MLLGMSLDLKAFMLMVGYDGSYAIRELWLIHRKPNMCRRASRWPSCGNAIWEAILDTSVMMSTRLISIIHRSILMREAYHGVSSGLSVGVVSSSGS